MKEKLDKLIIAYGRVNLSEKIGVSYVTFMKLYKNTDELTYKQGKIINNLISELDAERQGEN